MHQQQPPYWNAAQNALLHSAMAGAAHMQSSMQLDCLQQGMQHSMQPGMQQGMQQSSTCRIGIMPGLICECIVLVFITMTNSSE